MTHKHRFGLKKKLVIFVVGLALITFGTSFLFIEFIHPTFFPDTNRKVFEIVTYLLGILWSGILAAILGFILVKPLQQLEEAAKKAATGDIQQEIEIPKSDDEIQSLAKAFQLMMGNLHRMVQSIEQNATHTNESIKVLSEEVETTKRQSDAITMTVAQISEGATNSAMAISETVEAIADVRTLAEEVDQRASHSSNNAEMMLRELDKTTVAINEQVSGIQKIVAGNEKAVVNVKQLEQNAQEVEQIIELVKAIAEQTNLLALNASIEAARAGEQGKGFAVVAEEVRKLADESSKATEGVTQLIQTMRTDVNRVVTQMNEQVEIAQKEVSRVKGTTDAVDGMTEIIQQMASSVVDISQLVKQQLNNIELTAQQSEDVAAIAQETSAGAQEVRAASDEQLASIVKINDLSHSLKAQSEMLSDEVHKFKQR